MNARMRRAYDNYKRSYNYDLWDVYTTFSRAKRDAWEYCENLCYKYNGHGLKVIGANTMQFTAGFEYEDDGKPMFMYITKASDTSAEIDEQ